MAQLFALWRICILTGSMPVNLPQGVCVQIFFAPSALLYNGN
jgi:hypothetical protein